MAGLGPAIHERVSMDHKDEEETIAKARAEIAAGDGVPHKKVRAWLKKLSGGRIEPPPTS
jgi:hypothetical protein